jgi:thiol:disulfide interchange protein DsbD
MVPITIAYFTNHSAGNRKGALNSALTFSIGIILTFTALGIALALIFGAAGVNQFAANPWVNLLITAIFIGFAFSLFGVYFVQLPSVLTNKLSSFTRSKENSHAVGTLLMGFTFTLTSFTCTAPFVGTLLVMTAQGNWRWPLAGMLAYSAVFALPFFFLALVPQMLRQMPKSGGWMNSVKVVMGFLEIAAAMKFLSNSDLVWGWGIFTREVVLAVWVGIGILIATYLLGYFRFEHETPVGHIGPVRVGLLMFALTVTIYLGTGLLGHPLGELDSFLPPSSRELISSTNTKAPSNDLPWIVNDFEAARRQARQENKYIFVDFTGYTCTNCRWMETNMFSRPEIRPELEKYVRLRLYTDGEGALYQQHQNLQQAKFGTVALPFYAVLTADGESVATYPGLTRDPAEFISFLQRGKTR